MLYAENTGKTKTMTTQNIMSGMDNCKWIWPVGMALSTIAFILSLFVLFPRYIGDSAPHIVRDIAVIINYAHHWASQFFILDITNILISLIFAKLLFILHLNNAAKAVLFIAAAYTIMLLNQFLTHFADIDYHTSNAFFLIKSLIIGICSFLIFGATIYMSSILINHTGKFHKLLRILVSIFIATVVLSILDFILVIPIFIMNLSDVGYDGYFDIQLTATTMTFKLKLVLLVVAYYFYYRLFSYAQKGIEVAN